MRTLVRLSATPRFSWWLCCERPEQSGCVRRFLSLEVAMHKKRFGIPIVALAVLVSAAHVRADEVTDWNQTLFRSAVVAGSSRLNMNSVAAMVQAAVFDAINCIDRRYTPIHVTPNAPASASRRAAAVQAAYVMIGKHYGTGGLFTTNQQGVLD